jgi:hypothetical protein
MKKELAVLALTLLTCGQMTSDPNNPNNPSNPSNPNNPPDPNNPNNPNNPGGPVASLDSELKNGSRLRNKYYQGSDGTVAMAFGLFDTMRNEDCSFGTADDGQTRCLPSGVYASSYYADSSCSTPLAFDAGCGAVANYILFNGGSGTCSAGYSIAPANLFASAPTTIYTKSGATCTASTNPLPSYRWYRAGAVIPATSFVSATIMK